MANYETDCDDLLFPHRQQTRLRITLNHVDLTGTRTSEQNDITFGDRLSIEGLLKTAQQEITEQEIFTVLVKESSLLPTASARVSERLIVIEATEDMELRFELVRQ
jgi:mediator of RNA polymerase II transcription subunit 17, fungi type